MRSPLRSPAQVEGPQGVLPQPEKDLERPSSTRLEARFPYCREPAYCILSAYCILHIECSTFHSIIFQDLWDLFRAIESRYTVCAGDRLWGLSLIFVFASTVSSVMIALS